MLVRKLLLCKPLRPLSHVFVQPSNHTKLAYRLYSSNQSAKMEINDIVRTHLQTLQQKYESLMQNPPQVTSHEVKGLAKIIEAKKNYEAVLTRQVAAQQFIADNKNEKELRELAKEELAEISQQVHEAEQRLVKLLITEDTDNERNIILEIRPAAGGDEAGLFALDLFRMYEKYAELKGWEFESIELSTTGVGGCKEAIAMVKGQGVFGRLKYESGVHRIQRVPETEKQGRVHTSTATVAVLPEAEDIDVKLEPKDLKIETMRAGGAGGQHVNKTESAVRITHIPTGVTVSCSDDRSQHANKEKAMRVLRSRLYEIQRLKAAEERASSRSSQIGRGDRSEKIRTYNVPQDRVTDHRIGVSHFGVDKMMNGELIDTFIEELNVMENIERFKELCENFAKQQQPQQPVKDDKKKKK